LSDTVECLEGIPRMLKKTIIIILILLSLKFFQLVFIPEIVIKLSEWIGFGIILVFLVISFVYNQEKQFKKHFTFPIILILLAVAISMVAVNVYHDQSFLVTLHTQRAIYLYFAYFLLHYLKVSGEFLIKTFIAIAILYIGLYISQTVLYPTQITNAKMFLDRGTLRIFAPGAGYMIICYYIWLFLFFKTLKFKYILALLVTMAVVVMLGTRQVLATMLLITIIFILQSKIIKSKFLLFLLIFSAIIPVYLLFQDILVQMVDVTREQSRGVESNIRVRAAEFFLTDYFPKNKFAYFTGNGVAGSSAFGAKTLKYAEGYGYFQSDIGLIGEYSKFGVLFVLGVVIILFRTMTTRLPEKLLFIRYNFLGIIITIVTGAGAFGTNASTILLNVMLLYMIDLHLNDENAFSNYPKLVKKDESRSGPTNKKRMMNRPVQARTF